MFKVLVTLSLSVILFACGGGGGGDHSGDGGGGGDGGANAAPIADAGPDQSVSGDALVSLDGAGSSDPDGDPLTYLWRQRAGTPVTLSSETAASPSFVAPGFSQQLVFELVVSDGIEASAPDTVVVTVSGFSGLRADVTGNPSDPTELVPTSDPRDLELHGDVLVVADGTDGVVFVDVSMPLEATILGTFAEPSIDVELRWPHVVSLSPDGNLVVIDATTPSAPVEVTRVNGADDQKQAFTGNGALAVFGFGAAGLTIVDATQPGFRPLATIAAPYASNARMVGDLLYVSAWDELRVYDLANPASPTLLGAYSDGEGAALMRVEGDLAYTKGRSGLVDQLKIVDFSTPAAPALRGVLDFDAYGLGVTGSTVCAGQFDSTDEAVVTIDATDPDAPAIVGSFSTTGLPHPRVESVDAEAGHCYARLFDRVLVLDVSDPTAPALASTIMAGSRDIAVDGGVLYVTTWMQLSIYDVSIPTAPVLLGSLPLSGDPSKITPAGSTVFLESDVDGAYVVDVSTLSAPTLVRELLVPLELTDIEVGGALLFGTYATPWGSHEGLHVFDLAEATSPTLVGVYRAEGALGVQAESASVYLHRYTDGFERVDVSTSHAPVGVGAYDTWCTSRAFDVAAETLFCGASTGLSAYDFAPIPPTSLGSFDVRSVRALRHVSPHLFAAEDDGPSSVRALDPAAPGGPVAWARAVSGTPAAIAVGPEHVYTALVGEGVHVGRFAAGLAPDALTSLAFDVYPVSQIAAQDGLVYVLRWNELLAYDFGGPTPALVGTVSFAVSGSARMAVSEGYVYLAHDDRLEVYDATLGEIGEIAVTGVSGIAASGRRAYLATSAGVQQYEVSPLGGPSLRATFADLTFGEIVAFGEIAYVAVGTTTHVVDFSTATPTERGTFTGRMLALDGGLLVSVGTGGLELRDLTDPSAPSLAGARLFDGPSPAGVALGGSTIAYYGWENDPRAELWILDASATDRPVVMGRLGLLNETIGAIAVDDGRVYVLHTGEGSPGTYVVSAFSSMAGAVTVTRAGTGPVATGEAVSFDVSWDDHDLDAEEHVACAVSAGSCEVVTTNALARTATVSWTAPPTAGGFELAVSVGHQELVMVGRARIEVE